MLTACEPFAAAVGAGAAGANPAGHPTVARELQRVIAELRGGQYARVAPVALRVAILHRWRLPS
eukprot:gene4142-22970_t